MKQVSKERVKYIELDTLFIFQHSPSYLDTFD